MSAWISPRLEFQAALEKWFGSATWNKKPKTISTRRREFTHNRNVMASEKSGLLIKVESAQYTQFIGLRGSIVLVPATLDLFNDHEADHHIMLNDVLRIIHDHSKDAPYMDVIVRNDTDDSDSYKNLFRTIIDVEARKANV